jgi:outer membrane receptor for ferrienterochelin and colicin
MGLFHRACFALGLALVPSLAGAAEQESDPAALTELSLEELMQVDVVYGASKHFQTLLEAPSAVSIVTADEIRRYGYRTLADVLRNVRGFYVTYDRNYSYIGVRGFARPGDYNTRILMLVDGHRINDNIYDATYAGMELAIDLDLIDRIEVIRGPASSLYGTSAFFGVINLITRRGRDWKGPGLALEGGTQETFRGRLTWGKQFETGLEALGSGTYYTSQGQDRLYFPEFDRPETSNGIARDADGEKSRSLFSKLSYRGLTLEGAYVSRDKTVPTAPFDTVFNDSRTSTRDARGYLDLQYERTPADGLGVQARLYFDLYDYGGTYILDDSPDQTPPPRLDKDFGRGTWWGAELKLSRRLFERHRLTIGADLRDNVKQSQGDQAFDPVYVIAEDERRSTNAALYAQDEFKIRDDLILSAGVRYDHHSVFGGTIKPRLALIYNPFPKAALKLLYGEAYRAPNAYELLYESEAARSKGDLRPETIRTGEVVWEQNLGDHLFLGASGFWTQIRGIISQESDPEDLFGYGFDNREKAAAKGLELDLEGHLSGGAESRFSYTFQHATDGDGAWLSNSPRHLVKLNLGAPLFDKRLFAGLELHAMGSRLDRDGGKIDPFLIANLTLSTQKLIQGLEVSASVYNLFDTRYGDPGAQEHRQVVIEQDGRRLGLKLGYRF